MLLQHDCCMRIGRIFVVVLLLVCLVHFNVLVFFFVVVGGYTLHIWYIYTRTSSVYYCISYARKLSSTLASASLNLVLSILHHVAMVSGIDRGVRNGWGVGI